MVVNQLGYSKIARHKYQDAIDLFEYNTEQHPGSPNVYDSLGEAYENAGNPESAFENFSKAVELGIKNNDGNLSVYKTNRDRVKEKLNKK